LGFTVLAAAFAMCCLASIYVTYADHSDDHPRVATVPRRPEAIALYIAKRKELDKKQKLEIARIDVKSSNEALELLQKNGADVALSGAINAMLMFAKGAKIRVIGVVAGTAPYSLVAGSSVTTVKDLSGKEIGIAGEEEKFLFTVVMRQVGVGAEKLKPETVSEVGDKIVRLDQGRLDGAMFQWPSQLQAVRSAKMRVVVDVPDVVRSYVYSVMVVEEGYVAKRRSAGMRLLRVMTATTDWLANSANDKESAALIREYVRNAWGMDFSEADAARLRELLISKGVWPKDVRPDRSMFELNVEIAQQLLKNGKIDVERLLDPSLAKESR